MRAEKPFPVSTLNTNNIISCFFLLKTSKNSSVSMRSRVSAMIEKWAIIPWHSAGMNNFVQFFFLHLSLFAASCCCCFHFLLLVKIAILYYVPIRCCFSLATYLYICSRIECMMKIRICFYGECFFFSFLSLYSPANTSIFVFLFTVEVKIIRKCCPEVSPQLIATCCSSAESTTTRKKTCRNKNKTKIWKNTFIRWKREQKS